MGAIPARAFDDDDDAQTEKRSVPPPVPKSAKKKQRKSGWGFAMFLLVLLLLAIAAALGFYYLVHQPLVVEGAESSARASELEGEVGRLEERLGAIEAQLAEVTAERDRLRGEHGQLEATVREREAQIAALEAAQRDLEARFGSEIADGSVHITGGGGRLSVGLSDRILFPSGSATLSEQGKALLRRVAESLRTIEGRIIQVEGHTDALQPSRALAEQFPTNWELSAARATNVVRFLEECEISGDRLVASGFSQYRPAANNRTETGRRRNRRIELNLLPAPARAP